MVEYATEKGMQLALSKAGEYNGQKFHIEKFNKQLTKKKKTKKEDDPDWLLNPQIQEELKVMGRTDDLQSDYFLRSKGIFFYIEFLRF